MRPQPMLVVHDVEVSGRFYRRLLGAAGDHGGEEYERLVDGDGRLIMQLHAFAVEHHHGPLADPDDRPYGNGVLVWFEVDDFDDAVARAAELGTEIVRAPHRNPNPAHREIWLRDLDGYLVVLASPDGESPWPDSRVG